MIRETNGSKEQNSDETKQTKEYETNADSNLYERTYDVLTFGCSHSVYEWLPSPTAPGDPGPPKIPDEPGEKLPLASTLSVCPLHSERENIFNYHMPTMCVCVYICVRVCDSSCVCTSKCVSLCICECMFIWPRIEDVCPQGGLGDCTCTYLCGDMSVSVSVCMFVPVTSSTSHTTTEEEKRKKKRKRQKDK